MTKEHRHLIKDEADKLMAEYEQRAADAKEKGNTIEAYANATGSKAILELMLKILLLDAQDKI